ncbi:Protein of unknown function [Pyronema omphalodes CBS 100304]|uniref:Uncharacterized protein n=1 Tax=Pyronema omphalodes (strain CBS 100304) TaxID=1076935 RepID=U4KWN8_PYROM|nr:Protein of unknown function [Pyronema omphalodes CBS 100304]
MAGDTFNTFTDFKHALDQWSVSANFETKMRKSNRKLNLVEITIVNPEHTTCIGSRKPPRSAASKHTLLRAAIPEILNITNETTPKEVQDALQLHHGNVVNYAAAHKVLTTLRNKDIKQEPTEWLESAAEARIESRGGMKVEPEV